MESRLFLVANHGDKIEVGYVWVDASHWYKPDPAPLEKWAKGELKK